MTDQPAVLRFATIRDALDRLQIALTNLLDREFPKVLSPVPGLQPFLLVAIKAATNTYEAIRYLAADIPEDASRRLEFGLVVSPLARSLADLLFTIVFMREDLPPRCDKFHRGGWRELKEDYDRYCATYGALPEWQNWLGQYKAALEANRQTCGISEAEASNTKLLPYWPTPPQMLKERELSDENRTLLQFLNDWLYRGLSADAHMSSAGIIRRHGFLLLTDAEGRERILAKLKSDGVFTATTLVLAICTEINNLCRYGREEKLSYLWRIITEYWGEAKDLFDRRYRKLLNTC